MDNDLNRSVRFLEDALSTPARGLFRTPITSQKKNTVPDLGITLCPGEIDALQNHPSAFYETTMNDLLSLDKTIPGGIIQKEFPWKSTVDSLFVEFFEIMQGQTGSQDSLEIVSELARCCADALKVVRGLKSKVATNSEQEEKWLEKERDTWRLIFILFQDRLLIQGAAEEDIEMIQYFGKSEKSCVENLFKRDNLIRECQLVIDWLEVQACEKDEQSVHFSDAAAGWENTLHQLESSDSIAFKSSRPIVDSVDPDAPHYQKKSLHDLDSEDDKRLAKSIFKEIRCGKLEEAQKLGRQCGHSWKAAIFEGWHLYHNANIKEDNVEMERESDVDDGYEEMDSNELKDIEGNCNRDIWKIMALRYSKQDWIGQYEKASIGTFCGYLNAIIPICVSWEDHLWAYMKTVVDIRVESEIRDCCTKDNGYVPLPDEYWLQRMSLNEVFTSLESSKSKSVREEAKEPQHLIQKHIILDDINILVQDLQEWAEGANVTTHFLRFSAHLVLFLDQVGRANNRESVERVLEAYIKSLMQMNETQLVAYYVSKLNVTSQVYFYAQHLEKIVEDNERRAALDYAERCGMDVLSITKRIVENVRRKPEEVDAAGNLQKHLTETDKLKISALDWLVFYESQRVEILTQSNGLIFDFLVLGKPDAAQLAFNKVPNETVADLTAELGDSNEEVNAIIKEHLSYKAYLDAYEAFNEWFTQAKNKPSPPAELSDNAQFPEKVAHQHRVSQYKAELDRWKLTTSHLANTAKTLLYNVLLFPDGWLVGARSDSDLRKIVLPEVTFLLCSILCESEMYEKCVELADIIASEQHCLYREFSKDQLSDFLAKIAEAALALTDIKKDPWGYDLEA